jgi:hypothetical protein
MALGIGVLQTNYLCSFGILKGNNINRNFRHLCTVRFTFVLLALEKYQWFDLIRPVAQICSFLFGKLFNFKMRLIV